MSFNFPILIEGPDGAGKSSLAKLMSNGVYIHGSYSDPVSMARYFKQLMPKTIVDRSFISEIIYSKVLGRPSRISHEDENYLLSALIYTKAVVMYCTAPFKVVERRAFERGEDYVTTEQLKQIHELYEEYFIRKNISHIKIEMNFSKDQLESYTNI